MIAELDSARIVRRVFGVNVDAIETVDLDVHLDDDGKVVCTIGLTPGTPQWMKNAILEDATRLLADIAPPPRPVEIRLFEHPTTNRIAPR